MDGIVLFADNMIFSNEGNENQLLKLFLQKSEFSVVPINNLKCLEATIKSISTFKACIIDWNFESPIGENEEDELGVQKPTQTPMSILENNTLYTLIYVYSQVEIPEKEKAVLNNKYGDKIRFRIKANDVETEYNAISNDIKCFEKCNVHMNVPFIWSQSINQATQTIFSELESANTCWIREIKDTAKNDGGDATSEVINIFNNLLCEDLIQNKGLRDTISTDSANNTSKDEENTATNTAKLYRRIYYSITTKDAPLMTGDIFKFDDDNYGIIITPECELSNPSINNQKEVYDFLIIQKSLSNKFQEEKQRNYQKNPNNIKDIFNNGVISRHLLISFPFDDNYCNNIGLIDFAKSFQTKKKEVCLGFKTNYKLNAPYIHQLRQRFLAYFGRYGVPAIPESLKDYNLKG